MRGTFERERGRSSINRPTNRSQAAYALCAHFIHRCERAPQDDRCCHYSVDFVEFACPNQPTKAAHTSEFPLSNNSSLAAVRAPSSTTANASPIVSTPLAYLLCPRAPYGSTCPRALETVTFALCYVPFCCSARPQTQLVDCVAARADRSPGRPSGAFARARADMSRERADLLRRTCARGARA